MLTMSVVMQYTVVWIQFYIVFLDGSPLQDVQSTIQTQPVIAQCQFPSDFQGTYKLQDDNEPPKYVGFGLRDPIKYKTIFIGPNSAPEWGECIETNEDSFVLAQRQVGGSVCFRCMLLILRNPNVLQSYMKSDQCFSTAAMARRSCPSKNDIRPGDAKFLWRSKDEFVYQHCPIGGHANVSYTVMGRNLCTFPSSLPSTMSNCKRGYQLDISMKSCSFGDKELSLECLGTWSSDRGDGDVYFAMYNAESHEYRCGLLNTATSSEGYIHAALSNDSSCSHYLTSSSDGYEVFTLYQEKKTPLPNIPGACTYPDWMQGDWEMMTVHGNTLSYFHNYDPTTMTTVYARCGQALPDNQYFTVYSRDHCGDSVGYRCLQVRRRFELGQVDCPLLGKFTTKDQFGKQLGPFCFNVSTECNDRSKLEVNSYFCNSNVAIPTLDHNYQCVASWTERGHNLVLMVQGPDQHRQCIAVRKTKNGGYTIQVLGPNCNRSVLSDDTFTDSQLSAIAKTAADSMEPKQMALRMTSKCQIPTKKPKTVLISSIYGYQNEDSEQDRPQESKDSTGSSAVRWHTTYCVISWMLLTLLLLM